MDLLRTLTAAIGADYTAITRNAAPDPLTAIAALLDRHGIAVAEPDPVRRVAHALQLLEEHADEIAQHRLSRPFTIREGTTDADVQAYLLTCQRKHHAHR